MNNATVINEAEVVDAVVVEDGEGNRLTAFVAAAWKFIAAIPAWCWEYGKVLAAVLAGVAAFAALVWAFITLPVWAAGAITFLMLAVIGWMFDHFGVVADVLVKD